MTVRVGKSNKSGPTSYSKLICDRIAALRPKLLDLTNRNPLIATKFSDRSNSLVRIVDEVPELLFQQILSKTMNIIPLPDLGTDPADEKTRKFQNALAEARLNDQTYLDSLDEIDQECDDAPNLLAQAERHLKDRLREDLKFPRRQTESNLSLSQHAKNHNISPHFELPHDDQQHEDGRHSDQDIQTLLLPDVLERRLNSLLTKEKTWKEETGISVLHAAFGFLEWQVGNNSKSQFSPLVLIPVVTEKKQTQEGRKFWVNCDEGNAQENKILAEKLRLEFNIILPEYVDQPLEEYFTMVSEQSPPNMTWKIRRWAAIGVFPSARLAMYHDLDPEGWDFASHEVISGLLGGSDTGYDAVPYGDEYDTDDPEIESKFPYLIADADSSQVSAIVDLANGKNLALEGPPGTGKSQTIVNTIAASLGAGKKVLFVAEKSAALEVVRSRLESCEIGNFILPLQANRSSKDQVFSSIRDRIDMKPCTNPSELNNAIREFKETRVGLKAYLDTLSSNYGETDFTVHTILGRSMKNMDQLNRLPENIKSFSIPPTRKLSSGKLQDILFRCKQIEESLANTFNLSDHWKLIDLPNIDPFQANELLDCAKVTSTLFADADKQRQELIQYQLSAEIEQSKLEAIKKAINFMPEILQVRDIDIASRLTFPEMIEEVENFLEETCSWRDDRDDILQYMAFDIDSVAVNDLLKIKELFLKYDLEILQAEHLDAFVAANRKTLENHTQVNALYEQLLKCSEAFSEITVSNCVKILSMVASLSKEGLAIRRRELDHPLIQTLLRKHATKAKILREQRALLSQELSISTLPEYETIAKSASTLSTAGLFSIFSREYRQAKQFYKSISKNPNFELGYAAKKLRELSEWKLGLKAFCENETLRNILGYHFDSIDTDFTPFEEVISFFNEIDQSFPGPNNTALREFLKYTASEKIQSLPSIDTKHPIYAVEDMPLAGIYQGITSLSGYLATLQSDMEEIKRLKVIFKDSEKILKEQITRLPERFERLLKRRDALRNNEEMQNRLSDCFEGEATDSDEIDGSITLARSLINIDKDEREALIFSARRGTLRNLEALILRILECDERAVSSLECVAYKTRTSLSQWRGNKSHAELSKWFELLAQDKEGLVAYSRLVAAKNKLQEDGYKPFIEALLLEKQNNICEIIEARIMGEMIREIYGTHGEVLASYNGNHLSLLRKRLQEADRTVIKLSRQHLQAKLYHGSSPPHGVGSGRKSEFTELALIKNELSKKKRHISVRSLTKRSAQALLELKPCWMMSPLAVAQYLPRGGIEFDLVIIDEASQMTPEDAVGALVRAKQALVVGDTNQLPPTTFFRKVIDNEDADEDEIVTEESILEMANACFKPARRLRWHYRSRNSRLISFSNKHVYGEKLVCFPAAQEDHPDMGVSFTQVKGIYSSGVNPQEARVMVDAIINFMQTHKSKSLGVVLLNQKQRDLLTDEMNYALEQNPSAREYVEKWEKEKDGLESFFIKNLENVQGDERDVIFIGTVYGPEKEGMPVMQRFGPINGITGKRRLNVLFSRAKERIITFSSMTATDIRAEENGNPGVYMLKCWLEYCCTGMLEGGVYSGKEPDSDFEEHVIKQIKILGCEAIPQIGVKGFSIDIGVKHPDWPHGFIMGVECDGATYHSSRSARDRDRLRQEVLEGLGWSLYRIWSTDWFEDPRRETEKLRATIKERLQALRNAQCTFQGN